MSRTNHHNTISAIDAYWRDRGHYNVMVQSERVSEYVSPVGVIEIYEVRSNLVNGLPPKSKASTQPRKEE